MTTQITAADPGLITLVTLLRFLGIGADPEQIRHRFGGSPVGIPEMLRVASEFGLKARARKTAWSRLPNSPLPAIAALKDGGFMFLGKAGEDKVLAQSPSSPRPALMTQAEFEAVWDGRLVFMTRGPDCSISPDVSISRGFSVQFTNTGGFSPKCSSPRSSCNSSRWSPRCSSRW